MSCPAERRLRKELLELLTNPMPGIYIDEEKVAKNINEWIVTIEGAEKTIYEGETFQLQFSFNEKYPFDSPTVLFIGKIPVHSHIYSNGHICLSILTDDWTPALSVGAVCLSIRSMLSSATKKERPPDDMIYTRTCSKNPKKTKWFFHDDTV
ncbi:unnamed protein product [Chironomus riparius]|uniref:N-terminal E2 ubiquitin-conjugating enzyme n=1 Tax=Chironomus riparius TaxID=315576 RepID=A0A9N9WQM7_9DIPT|nr:unnamed protein product [Chironomus riparius]